MTRKETPKESPNGHTPVHGVPIVQEPVVAMPKASSLAPVLRELPKNMRLYALLAVVAASVLVAFFQLVSTWVVSPRAELAPETEARFILLEHKVDGVEKTVYRVEDKLDHLLSK